MFKAGETVSEYVTQSNGEPVPDDQVATHGVELTIDEVYRVDGIAVLKEGEYKKADRVKIDPREGDDAQSMQDLHYFLRPGPHVVKFNEKIKIPENTVGFTWPRSRLIRNNINLAAAVWDSGYEGRGEGGLDVTTPVAIQADMPIAQIVFAKANTMSQYDGVHDGE